MIVAVATLLAVCPEAVALAPAARQQAACAFIAHGPAPRSVDTAALQRLLDQPGFSRVRKRNGSVMAVLVDRFIAWVKSFFETGEAASFAKVTPFVVLAIAFVVALAAALRLARRRSPRGPSAPAGPGAGRLELAAPPEHLGRARDLLSSSPREAIREALLALLSSLERRNLARPDRVKTNRELCRELAGRGATLDLVREVSARVDWYDRTFYSLADVPPAEAASFVAAIEALV